jgi:hypothetical protein
MQGDFDCFREGLLATKRCSRVLGQIRSFPRYLLDVLRLVFEERFQYRIIVDVGANISNEFIYGRIREVVDVLKLYDISEMSIVPTYNVFMLTSASKGFNLGLSPKFFLMILLAAALNQARMRSKRSMTIRTNLDSRVLPSMIAS